MSAREPILGIDVGGTKIAVGVAIPDGTVLAHRQTPSHAAEGPDAMIQRIADLSNAVVADAGMTLDAIERIGIGCGGPLDPWRGVVHNALNNPGWVDVPIVARIEEALGRPAVLDNDANAAALGEHRFGAGRGCAEMVYLTVSTGIGGGVIAGNRLLHGANGNAAELGHISVDARGRACHCGSVGCIEAYASGTSIAARAAERLALDATPSTLRSLGNGATAADVADAAARGDKLAGDIWDDAMRLLGAGIASMVHAFNPARVIIGGGVTQAGDRFFAPVRHAVDERTMPWLRHAVELVPAQLGPLTGILGAVAVAIDRGLPSAPAIESSMETTHARP